MNEGRVKEEENKARNVGSGEGSNVSWACWRKWRNSSAICGRPALIPWRDRSATFGRREELMYKTRNESNGTYSVHFKFPRSVGSTT